MRRRLTRRAVRAAREKSKKKYERDLALERAGPIGGLLTRLVRTIDLQEDILGESSVPWPRLSFRVEPSLASRSLLFPEHCTQRTAPR